MSNAVTYLKTQGDRIFEKDPFNEADNIVLAILPYIDLKGIVPSPEEGGYVTAAEAAERFFAEKAPFEGDPDEALDEYHRNTVLWYMGHCARYRNARLCGYTSVAEGGKGLVFTAITVQLSDGTVCIYYMGIGEKIVDWRQVFATSYRNIPAQKEATRYLEKMDAVCGRCRDLILGGHSKGGNLAMCAAMYCREEIRQRITAIYMNDSPGICTELLDRGRYRAVRHLIRRYVPSASIIGRLFEPDVPAVIVRSSYQGILQHDASSWQTEDDHFAYAPEQEAESRAFNETFREWIASAGMQERKRFVRDFFDALESGGAREFTDLEEQGAIGKVLRSIRRADRKSRELLHELVFRIVGVMGMTQLNRMTEGPKKFFGGIREAAGRLFGRKTETLEG